MIYIGVFSVLQRTHSGFIFEYSAKIRDAAKGTPFAYLAYGHFLLQKHIAGKNDSAIE